MLEYEAPDQGGLVAASWVFVLADTSRDKRRPAGSSWRLAHTKAIKDKGAL
jgi:hypothetical protein